MVSRYSDLTKLKHAKAIAKEHGLFVVELPGKYLLYREAEPRNQFVGKRKTIDALMSLVKTASGIVESKPSKPERKKVTEEERIEEMRRFDEDQRRQRAEEELSNFQMECEE